MLGGMTVRLSDHDELDALAQLHRAGIIGSDATTCLHAAALVAPDLPYRAWRRSLAGRPPETLAAEYGADAVRAAIVLSQA